MSNEGNVIDQIYSQVLLIRDLVNEPRIGFKIRNDLQCWFKVCSAMDVVEDTCLAINAFPEFAQTMTDKGSLYLAVYGLLQSLFVQQNAVADLCEGLGIAHDRTDEVLRRVRNVRNDCVGHPTDRRDGSSHGISQVTLCPTGFQMLSQTSEGETIFTDIDLNELIEQQGSILSGVLAEVVAEIKRRDKKVREKHRTEKLKSLFPQNTWYVLDKIVESTCTDDRIELGRSSLMITMKALNDFETALEERGLGLNAYVGVRDVFKSIAFSQTRLEIYFREGALPGESRADSQEATYIFARYYREQVLELLQMAKSIDDDYATDT